MYKLNQSCEGKCEKGIPAGKDNNQKLGTTTDNTKSVVKRVPSSYGIDLILNTCKKIENSEWRPLIFGSYQNKTQYGEKHSEAFLYNE